MAIVKIAMKSFKVEKLVWEFIGSKKKCKFFGKPLSRLAGIQRGENENPNRGIQIEDGP